MRAPRSTSTPRAARIAGWPMAVGIAVVATLFCAVTARDEVKTQRTFRLLGTERAGDLHDPVAAPSGNPRLLLYTAIAEARAGGSLAADNPERCRLLEQARRHVDLAVSGRPRWAEAWVVSAHVAAMTEGPSSAMARRAYEQSYVLAPFLRESADWRLQFAVAEWPSLSAKTQSSAVNEAIMLARLGPKEALHARILTEGSPLHDRYAGLVSLERKSAVSR